MKLFREKKTDSNSHVFISYSSKDSKVAKQIYKELENLGLNPWLSELDTPPGANYAAVIPKVIEDSLAIVVLITKDSVKSAQVLRELNLSVGRKHLIPVNMSGRPDILRSEPTWEYFLGIVQMFEHTDVKSTAEKILGSIEITSGIKFREIPETKLVEETKKDERKEPEVIPTSVQEVPLEPVPTVVEVEPELLSAESPIAEENEVEATEETETQPTETSPFKQFIQDKRKVAVTALVVLVLAAAVLRVIGSNELEFPIDQTTEFSENSLDTRGRWIDRNLRDTGKGHYFEFDNDITGASGEYPGFFNVKSKKSGTPLLYISITLDNDGRFTGILFPGDLELNGFVTLNSAENSGYSAITFEGCKGKLPWVTKSKECTFYQVIQ